MGVKVAVKKWRAFRVGEPTLSTHRAMKGPAPTISRRGPRETPGTLTRGAPGTPVRLPERAKRVREMAAVLAAALLVVPGPDSQVTSQSCRTLGADLPGLS